MARGSIVTRETKPGEKRYHAVLQVEASGGDKKQVWKTFKRKKQAEEYLDRYSTDVREGTYREIKRATFAQYVEHYRNTHLIPEQFKPSTYNGYCSIVDCHLLPEFGDLQMTAITAKEINTFKARLLKGRSGRTAKNVLILLNKIFSKAIAESYLQFSPMTGVDRPKVSKEKMGRALKPEEINVILKKCDPETRLMVLTGTLTGMRRGEQFGLDWENVDLENSLIKIRRSLYWRFGKNHQRRPGEPSWTFVVPKSKYSVRDIDLSPELRRELLEHYMRSSKKGLVFHTSKGTPLSPDNVVGRGFADAIKAAEVGKVRWHDLRHSFGSLKLEQGESIYYVQRQMGHSSIQVTVDLYGHLLKDRNPEAAKKTDALIFGYP